MEKSSQIAWKFVPLRHFFPAKGCPAYRSSAVSIVSRPFDVNHLKELMAKALWMRWKKQRFVSDFWLRVRQVLGAWMYKTGAWMCADMVVCPQIQNCYYAFS
jgi:hypothetical protein